MCGIAGILNIKTQTKELRDKALKMAQKIRHRGPDWSGIYVGGSAILAHERLSIVDPQSGGQPLYSPDRKQVLAVNGEIYNHRDIRARYAGQYDFQTGSDCEVILALYKDKGIHFLEEISGIFAFVLYDEEKDEFLIARDPIGVIPLYIGKDKDGKIYFGSELKALEGFCDEYEPFLPGHYFYSKEGKMKRWYTREWTDYESVKDNDAKVSDVKEALEDAVHRQLMSDVPYGVLLSGGLDSSVISAIAKKYAAKRIETDGASDAWWPQLHSFAIGLKGAPDLIKAREVAEYIGTVHHEINYTVQEGLDAIRDVIYFIETYDVTTVRASTPMYLLARVIKSMGIKMVLSGEGADEVFGGYPWFHRKNFLSCNTFPWTPDLSFRKSFLKDEIADALSLDSYVQSSYENAIAEVDILPSDNDTECSRRRISYLNIRYFMQTLLNRMDRTSMFSGLEARVPFADKNLVSYVFNVPWEMKAKDGLVKNLLRQCAKNYLPDTITFRKKSPYPKTYHPYYEQLLRQRLSVLLTTGESPLLALIDKEKTMQFLNQEGDYGKPWYGQLMAGPQMIAYLLQIHYWLSENKIDLHL